MVKFCSLCVHRAESAEKMYTKKQRCANPRRNRRGRFRKGVADVHLSLEEYGLVFQITLEWDREETLWVSYVPGLNYLSTYGETRESVIALTRGLIAGYIEAALQEGLPLPRLRLDADVREGTFG
jgi:predicted RNase H-like HicB family nuclease